jgi:hypothetical protein
MTRLLNRKIITKSIGVVLAVGITGCSSPNIGSKSESVNDSSTQEISAVDTANEEISEDSNSATTASTDGSEQTKGSEELYEEFINGDISATCIYEGTESQIWFKDLPQDPEEWDSYSVSDEKVDLDNDGEDELIINGPYGGMYLDARDGQVYVLAQGEGTAGELSYIEYEDSIYIIHRDTSHGGRKIYRFDLYDGSGEAVESFDLSAEYWDAEYDMYDSDSDFTFKGEAITMEEYEKLMKEIFGAPTKVEYGAQLAAWEFQQDDDSEKIINDGSDTFYDAMEAFYAEEYTYKQSTDGLDGTLNIIQEFDSSKEFSIYDNNSNGYRFIALGSNVEYIKGDRLYLKYPETVYEDGTAVYTYYIIAHHGSHIFLFKTDENYENPEYIYTAWYKY